MRLCNSLRINRTVKVDAEIAMHTSHASQLETHKMSAFALPPRSGFSRPQDSVCRIWRVLASNWTTASSQLGLLPDRHELGLNLTALAPRDRIEDIALLMDQTARTRRCRKQLGDGSQHAIMPVGHNEVELRGSSCAQVL